MDIDLTAVVATVTVTALPHDSVTLGDFEVTFAPAVIQAIAVPPLSVSLGPANPVIEVLPAMVDVSVSTFVNGIVGTVIVGDPFYYPWTIVEGGSQDFDMTDMTEGDEDIDVDVTLPRTQWFRYYSPLPAELTINFDSTEDYRVTVYQGTTLDELAVDETHTASGPLTLTLNVITGYTYFSLHSDTDDDIEVDWTYVPVDTDLMIDAFNPVIDTTPHTLLVAVQGADASESLRFTWSPPNSTLIPSSTPRPITLATITSDFEGNLYIGSIPIPSVYAGTYTLNVEGVTSHKTSAVAFQVLSNPLPEDDSDDDAEPVEQLTLKWLWDDGAGHTWVMTNNPDSMLTVVAPKMLTAERTTSGAGQHVIWQGATPAVDWGFRGTVLSDDDYAEFEYFYNLDRKFYITTHRNITFVVTFRNLDMQPKKNGSNFWTFDYNAQLLLFGTKGAG